MAGGVRMRETSRAGRPVISRRGVDWRRRIRHFRGGLSVYWRFLAVMCSLTLLLR